MCMLDRQRKDAQMVCMLDQHVDMYAGQKVTGCIDDVYVYAGSIYGRYVDMYAGQKANKHLDPDREPKNT